MKMIRYSCLLLLALYACGNGKEKHPAMEDLTPQVQDNGKKIVFPNPGAASFFETEAVSTGNLNAIITAPAKVAATIVKSEEAADQNIVLFENPSLAESYTQLLQHMINIHQLQNVAVKQKKIELGRIKDLQEHGAATGHDLLEAQTELAMVETNLANEKAALIEHETKLKAGASNPKC